MSDERLIGHGRNPDRKELTPRELEVMRVVVECGGSTKKAAHQLGLSRQTIQNYRTICYAKKGATNAGEFWAAMGWLRLPPKK